MLALALEAGGFQLPEVYLRWRRATDEPDSAAAAWLESEQLDTGGAQDNDGWYTSEVIYSSSGEDHDFGDKKSACEKLMEEKNPIRTRRIKAGPELQSKGFFLFYSTSAEMRSDQFYLY